MNGEFDDELWIDLHPFMFPESSLQNAERSGRLIIRHDGTRFRPPCWTWLITDRVGTPCPLPRKRLHGDGRMTFPVSAGIGEEIRG